MANGPKRPSRDDRYFDDEADKEVRRVLRERAAEAEKKKRNIQRPERPEHDFSEDNFRVAMLLVVVVGFAGILGLIVRFFVD